MTSEVQGTEAPGSPPTAGTSEGPASRRLTRSRSDRWLGGVAGGLAEYAGIDPVLMRLLFALAALVTGGTALLVYIGAWIIVPEGSGETGGTPSEGRRRGGALLFGLVLVVVGGWTLLRALDLPTPPWGVTLSVLLIAAGSAIILTGRGGLHGGLLTLAIVLTGILALGAATFGGLRWESGFGDRTVAPMGYEQLEDAYQHSFGSMRVDLRNVELPPGTTAVRLNLSFGDLTVWLPPGVEYRIEGRTAFGEMRAERTPLTQGVNSRHAYETGGYQGASARLLLDIQSAFGSVEVRR